MFSETVEYALRAMVHLANRAESQTTLQISEITHVPAPYLAKILQNLSRKGLVKSQRGVHGGFVLAVPATELTILDVVQAVDPIKRIPTCPLGLESHRTKLCPLHKRLDDALATVEAAFRSTTLAALLIEPTTSKPLCPFPQTIEPPTLLKRRPVPEGSKHW